MGAGLTGRESVIGFRVFACAAPSAYPGCPGALQNLVSIARRHHVVFNRLYALIDATAQDDQDHSLVTRIHNDAEALANRDKKHCRKCDAVKEIGEFLTPPYSTDRAGMVGTVWRVSTRQNTMSETFVGIGKIALTHKRN